MASAASTAPSVRHLLPGQGCWMHFSCGFDWQRLQCSLWVSPPRDACSAAGGHCFLSWQQPCRQWPAGQRWRAVEAAAPAEQPSLPQGCSGLVHRREVHVDQLSCTDGIEKGIHRQQYFTRIAANNGKHWGDTGLQDKHLAPLRRCCCPGRVLQAACTSTDLHALHCGAPMDGAPQCPACGFVSKCSSQDRRPSSDVHEGCHTTLMTSQCS